jgi:Tfp pilus assembly protein PilV
LVREQGFTLLEGIVALLIVGLGVTSLLGALTQGRGVLRQTSAWSIEQERATDLLMAELRRWEQLRSEEARRSALSTRGEDPLLGAWTWQAELAEAIPGQSVGFYRLTLRWQDREVRTHAALRIL